MIPKDKAKELVDRFYQTTPNESFFNPPIGAISNEYSSWEQAKQCAVIAVDEIMNIIEKICLVLYRLAWVGASNVLSVGK